MIPESPGAPLDGLFSCSYSYLSCGAARADGVPIRRGVFSMRWHFTRTLVLVAGLGLAAAGCGKYSINNLRATQAFQTANEAYKKGEWKQAVGEYTRAVTLNPDLGYAYFFLGNSYDNLYKPTKKGDPEN